MNQEVGSPVGWAGRSTFSPKHFDMKIESTSVKLGPTRHRPKKGLTSNTSL